MHFPSAISVLVSFFLFEENEAAKETNNSGLLLPFLAPRSDRGILVPLTLTVEENKFDSNDFLLFVLLVKYVRS